MFTVITLMAVLTFSGPFKEAPLSSEIPVIVSLTADLWSKPSSGIVEHAQDFLLIYSY